MLRVSRGEVMGLVCGAAAGAIYFGHGIVGFLFAIGIGYVSLVCFEVGYRLGRRLVNRG